MRYADQTTMWWPLDLYLEHSEPVMSDETFCIYCQRQYKTPKSLRRHIERKHPDTYAYQNVNTDWSNDE